VSLRCEVLDEQVAFRVADTGRGIPPDELPHLFDRYWRGRSATYRGSGIGLAIARALVEAHSGRIWAESVEGEGSTFGFTLPRAP
jgi:signal transduction histidine kinase